MADVSRTVEVAIRGVDDISKTLSGVSSGLDSFGGKVTAVTGPLADLSKTLIQVELALGALAVGGLVLATRASGEFNDSFNEILTLLNISGGSVDQFRQDIIEYSRDSTASIEQITTATYNAISSGEDYTTSLELLRQAENLGIATKADLTAAINILKPTLNAFGKSTKDAADFSDILFTTVKSGKLTLSELEPVLANVTAIANAGGVPFDDLSAAIAGLTAAGVPVSQAITQIKGSLAAILAPSDGARKAAKELGVELGAEAVAAKGLDGVYKDLFVSTGGTIEGMKALIPRIEGANAAVVLGADVAGKYRVALDAMKDRSGAAGEAAKKMAENFTLANQNMINNFKATLIELAGPIEAKYSDFAEQVSKSFEAVSFAFHAGAFDPLYVELDSFSDDLLLFITKIANNLPEALEGIDFTKFISSLKGLGETVEDLFSAFFGEIDLTTAEGLQAALQKVVDAFTALNLVVDGILEVWEPFIKRLGDFVTEALKSEDASKKFIGEILGWAGVIDKAMGALGFLSSALTVLVSAKAVTSVITMGQSIGSLGTAATTLVGTLGILGGAVVAFAAGYALAEWAYGNVDAFKNLIDTMNQSVLFLSGLDEGSIKHIESMASETETAGKLAVALIKLGEIWDDWPVEVGTEILVKGTPEYEVALAGILNDIKSVPESKFVKIQGEILWGGELASGAAGSEDLKAFLFSPDEVDKQITFVPNVNDGSITLVQNKIDAGIPPEKKVEVKLEGDDLVKVQIAQINATADTIQSAFEWEAKVGIAEIEANADIMVALAETIASSFNNTGDTIQGLFSLLDDADFSTANSIQEQIRLENIKRSTLLDLEVNLTTAQIKYLNARTAAMGAGQSIVSINMEGIYPELELIMWEIVRRIQIQANAEGMEFLLGL